MAKETKERKSGGSTRERSAKSTKSDSRPSRASASRSAEKTNIKKEPPPYKEISKFSRDNGFHVTSTTGGTHNKGSAHYDQRAVDVSVKGKNDQEVSNFMKAAKEHGYKVRDERTHPAGQKVWGGPHIHLEVPKKTGKK